MNKFKIGDLPFDIKQKLELACQENEAHMPMLCYISPQIVEMANNLDTFDSKKLTNKTDIWSCACVFFEVIVLLKMFELQNNDIDLLFKDIMYKHKDTRVEDKYDMFNPLLKK